MGDNGRFNGVPASLAKGTTMTEDEVRRIVREEVAKAREAISAAVRERFTQAVERQRAEPRDVHALPVEAAAPAQPLGDHPLAITDAAALAERVRVFQDNLGYPLGVSPDAVQPIVLAYATTLFSHVTAPCACPCDGRADPRGVPQDADDSAEPQHVHALPSELFVARTAAPAAAPDAPASPPVEAAPNAAPEDLRVWPIERLVLETKQFYDWVWQHTGNPHLAVALAGAYFGVRVPTALADEAARDAAPPPTAPAVPRPRWAHRRGVRWPWRWLTRRSPHAAR